MAFERKLVIPIIGDSRSFERAIKRSITASHRFDSRIGRMGKAAAVGIAGVATAAGGLGIALGISAVKHASKFEESLSRIVGLAGQSQKQVKKWGDQLLGLGPALGKSPQELAEALYFIASSGVPASKAISVLTASAKASAAGLGETQVVADAVTSVMNAYGAGNMTAAHATDVLVATVREGKGEADQFAGVIGNVAAVSAKLKVPFEQVGAALAAMTQLGTDPATAATQLQAFYSQVLKVTSPMEKNAEKMGLPDFFTVLQKKLTSGKLLGALKYIKREVPNVLDQANIFKNVRALRAVLGLVETKGDRVAGVFNRMRNSTGSMNKAFGAAKKTSAHSFDTLHASVEALKIAFGQGLLPMVNRFARYLGGKFMDPKFIKAIRKHALDLGTAMTKFGLWMQGNWPAIKQDFREAAHIIKRIAENIQSVIDHMKRLKKWLDDKFGWASGNDATGNLKSAGQVLASAPPGMSTAQKQDLLRAMGITVNGDVNVHGVDDPKKLAGAITRHAKKHGHQTRGKSPGAWGNH